MNTDTGQIYRTPEDIEEALDRGEPVVPISEEVARIMEAGKRALNRAEKRRLRRSAGFFKPRV